LNILPVGGWMNLAGRLSLAKRAKKKQMADNVSPSERSRVMALVQSKDTSPEKRVRKALHAAGFRFRLHRADLPGKPDIVLPRYKVVVFVNGCFWHWHGCKRSRMPASNTAYWSAKIARNVRRDAQNQASLEANNWKCQVIWECELAEGLDRLISELQRMMELRTDYDASGHS